MSRPRGMTVDAEAVREGAEQMTPPAALQTDATADAEAVREGAEQMTPPAALQTDATADAEAVREGDLVAKKSAEAFSEIDAFAKKLLNLTGGRRIPRPWKSRLLRALRPLPMKRGRKIDQNVYSSIVQDLALLGDEAFERTKHNNPAEHMRRIAERHGVDEKTVRRIHAECPTLDRLDSLSPEKRRARIEGLALAICQRFCEPDK